MGSIVYCLNFACNYIDFSQLGVLQERILLCGWINLSVKIICLLAGTLALSIAAGCGGKLASPGLAKVTYVAPDGGILLQYADGKAAWKKIKRENIPYDMETAIKHVNEPARFVETYQGSTLTFPDGDTLNYQDLIKD